MFVAMKRAYEAGNLSYSRIAEIERFDQAINYVELSRAAHALRIAAARNLRDAQSLGCIRGYDGKA